MSEPIKIELELDLEALKEVIEESTSLNDNEEMFNHLVQIFKTKKQLKDILDQLISIETEAKGLIKSKADQLYGKEWIAVKGNGYKISKSYTGNVFNILEGIKPPKKLVKVKESLDTKLVEEHIKETGKLPKGVEYNPIRGTSVRVTINE